MFLTQFDQTFSSRRAHGVATRILVAGNCVQQGGLDSAQSFLERIDIEAIVINWHADNVQAVVEEDLKG